MTPMVPNARVIARAREMVPVEDLMSLIEDLVAWQERYQDRMASTSFFGTSIADDHEVSEVGSIRLRDDGDLERLIAEWPLRRYCDIEIVRDDHLSIDEELHELFDPLADRRERALVALV